MKYSFSAIASRAAATALFSAVVSIGSAIPAAAQLPNALPGVPACPPQSILSVSEHMLEALFFGASDPCGLAASAAPSRDAASAGPVHPITDILRELL